MYYQLLMNNHLYKLPMVWYVGIELFDEWESTGSFYLAPLFAVGSLGYTFQGLEGMALLRGAKTRFCRLLGKKTKEIGAFTPPTW